MLFRSGSGIFGASEALSGTISAATGNFVNVIASGNVNATNVNVTGTCTGCGGSAVPHDVTGSRAVTTVYQNTSGGPMLVTGSFELANTIFNDAEIDAYVGNSSPPSTSAGIIGTFSASGITQNIGTQITILVPNNYYYSLNDTSSGGASATLLSWTEYD